ncbi:HlyD family efflux transporter periplasmic adaptor subunit [Mesorhizobium sp. M7A.F.Ca.CA.002.15.2.1]|uniref:HlyD family secretion protein n=1 Tax=Mesorhizobium sp. M7A.F.Ca.CA.002.15.2.1 TaxID=2496678 RepID=UPI000FCCDD3E|nr:HlyD family efflux transporter periplasmic adaptor subunit [Mesorhizobium sp. M7A.F.Ca.CA.002.15.2.1]RVC13702.1 HlyD family efflux transporter periplasmic adaptor subunit [Mesorhizobium sp. M7A.F.Ca.CA.002.15.2.1]
MSFLCSLPLAAQLFSACAPAAPLAVGYVEGDYVLLAPIEVAQVETVTVKRGDRVVPGTTVVTLESADAKIAVAQAQAGLAQAQAQLADLQIGKRPEEIAVLKAEVDMASAQAADNQVKQAQAALEQAQWRLSKRVLAAPSPGRVNDVIRNPGDTSGPTAPVISILPDGAVKLSVYIPESAFSSVKVGTLLGVHCDGCGPDVKARVSYVSPDPEFTPPVIYSLENRQKLVYLVEARPEGDAGPLQPGQIVDVDLADSAR